MAESSLKSEVEAILLKHPQKRVSEILADRFLQEHIAIYKRQKQEEAAAKEAKAAEVAKSEK